MSESDTAADFEHLDDDVDVEDLNDAPRERKDQKEGKRGEEKKRKIIKLEDARVMERVAAYGFADMITRDIYKLSTDAAILGYFKAQGSKLLAYFKAMMKMFNGPLLSATFATIGNIMAMVHTGKAPGNIFLEYRKQCQEIHRVVFKHVTDYVENFGAGFEVEAQLPVVEANLAVESPFIELPEGVVRTAFVAYDAMQYASLLPDTKIISPETVVISTKIINNPSSYSCDGYLRYKVLEAFTAEQMSTMPEIIKQLHSVVMTLNKDAVKGVISQRVSANTFKKLLSR